MHGGVSFTDATHLACIDKPANDAGSEDVAVTNVDGSVDRAPDAFIYSDSPDGYRGGLYGGALSGTLTVLAFDNWTGTPISGEAIAGSNIATALTASFDSNGTAQFNDPSLQGTVTVTIVGVCHQPVTFVDVPVDTVTAYLNPTLDTACAMGDPPSQGNYVPTDDGEIDGELIWQGGIEFQKAAWGNVPMPTGAMQRQAAYVWTATGSPLDTLYLPATVDGDDADVRRSARLPVLARREPRQPDHLRAGRPGRRLDEPGDLRALRHGRRSRSARPAGDQDRSASTSR